MKTSCLLALLLLATAASAETIVIGGSRGWIEGVCYQPVKKAMVGDVLEFEFAGHDVHQVLSKSAFDGCDFSSSLLLAGVGESPFSYEITEKDAEDGILYFACTVGDHCSGGTQKVQVQIEPYMGQSLGDRDAPLSQTVTSVSPERCAEIQDGASVDGESTQESTSDCTEPVLQSDGRYYVSCVSPPATMTPGGVINNLFILQYPYPKDRRVVVGLRTWEFVQDVPGADDGSVIPVPINQLYVHHLSGRVVLGQGTEGIRRSAPDAPYPPPNAVLTGDEGDAMIFHIIDLRQVDDWLPCIECRCKDQNGTYLDFGGGDSPDNSPITGGVSCCTNCTDLEGPTVDYRMRYNVSYSDIPEDEPVNELLMLTADISPVVDRTIEFDVPAFQDLPEQFQKPGDPFVQRLEREMPFNEMFKHEFFGADYYGPDEVKLFRCVGHLHVAAIGMYLEDATTGERLCDGKGFYGEDPKQDKGFLNAIAVDDYQEPKVFPKDRMVRLITEYNATEVHTGVMGMLFIFISGERTVSASEADLKIDVCAQPTCDTSLLPVLTLDDVASPVCEDTLAQNPACQFGGLCDCDDVINAAESTGCGGTYSSQSGDLVVNSVCARSCGCPVTECEDTLPNSPLCQFGQLCDCESFVNSPDSTGCGGAYTSEWGDTFINDYCPNFCNACPETSQEELLEEAFVEQLEADLDQKCKYATEECREALHNAYSCGIERPGVESLDTVIRRATATHGSRLALKYSKLGSSSLHNSEVAREEGVGECVDQTSASSRVSFVLGALVSCTLIVLYL